MVTTTTTIMRNGSMPENIESAPVWAMRLVMEIFKAQDEHPSLYEHDEESEAEDRFTKSKWCPCGLLDGVPNDIRVGARAIRMWNQRQASGSINSDGSPAGAETNPEA